MAIRTRRRAPDPASLRRVATAQPARPAHLRTMNCGTLLRLLRAHSPCSRADLVRLSGLTAPTVSLAMNLLASHDLVEALGEGASSGGRPPALLRFKASHGHVAGVDIGGTRVRMVLADLNGKPVARWATRTPEAGKSPAAIVSLIRAGLDDMTEQAGISGPILHLTAGAPGVTDVGRGVVLAAPNLAGWNDVPLRSLLELETGISTTVENDTNLAAVGEFAVGVAAGVQNFIFVALGTGVGAGIFLRGALHHGANWSAGEIGYLPILGESHGKVRMRETGQLERIIGGAGIEARWQQLLARCRRASNPELMALHAPEILNLADRGDPRAAEVLDTTAHLLSDALSTIALFFNPELIVLGGGIGSHPALCKATEAFLRRHDFAVPELRSSSLGTEAQLRGAISLSLIGAEAKLLC